MKVRDVQSGQIKKKDILETQCLHFQQHLELLC